MRRLDVPRAHVTAGPVGDGASLSGGMLVEASVVARLLKLKLLTLDATVLVVPAASAAVPVPRRDLEQWDPGRAPVRPSRTGSSRRRLSEAITSIEEGAALLAEARRNRSLLDGPNRP